jgi:tripartite-type tricarboxylate transporter receptor subunit TctC
MTILRRQFLQWAAGAAALPAVVRTAAGQSFPSRPITIIVPTPPGGATDAVARVLAERMRQSLGQPVLVENVAGASGTIGTNRAVRAAPDGYTIVVGGWAFNVLNGAIFTLPYDPAKDFEPVGVIERHSFMIAGRRDLPANDLKELITWLKAQPGQATFGTTGAGGISTVGAVFFQNESGTKLRLVPYRGLSVALQDLVAGQIDLMLDFPSSVLPLVRAGSIKAFAVTAPSRLPAAPDIPAAAEAGLPGFTMSSWLAFFAPKGTPKPIVDALSAANVEALADPSVARRYASLGADVPPREEQTPEGLAALHQAEVVRWHPIIKAAGIKVD